MVGNALNSKDTLSSLRLLRLNQLAAASAMQSLATGKRINRGADDPAGLIASARLSSAIAQLQAETEVASRASAVASTADAALGEASNLLTEARRLAVANADSTLSPAERQANQSQIDSILASVDRIGNTTQFNGTKLLDGNLTIAVTGASLSVARLGTGTAGATEIDGQTYTLADLKTGGALAGSAGGEKASAVLDRAIGEVATQRARIGAFQSNTLAVRVNSLGVAVENLSAARSAIEDTDYAATIAESLRSRLLATFTARMLGSEMAAKRRAFSLLK